MIDHSTKSDTLWRHAQDHPALPLRLRLRDSVEGLLIRVAASGAWPPDGFLKLPDPATLAARRGLLSIEIVSHCWQYAHLLAYQLSSIVRFPPTRAKVRMTVFHAAEDAKTRALLTFFGALSVPNVGWNWQVLRRERLFRRAIGRNLAARATRADWVWFTDCDIVFHRGCLDALADRLQGSRERLVHPREERVTAMLPPDDPLLAAADGEPRLVDIDAGRFTPLAIPVAKGAYQVVHGDIARACGYCERPSLFQRPVPRWAKTWEDRTWRWLMRTDGTPLDVPGVHRIRHVHKGRYGALAGTRSGIRLGKYWLGDRLKKKRPG